MNEVPVNDVSIEEFTEFAIQLSHLYISSGGPTSRLEERVSVLGENFGFAVEVFSTSTSVFVTTKKIDIDRTFTRMGRIANGTNDLSELARLDGLFSDVENGSIQDFEELKDAFEMPPKRFSVSVLVASILLLGVSASLPLFGSVTGAILSGTVAVLVFWLSGPLAKYLGLHGVFSEFIGCFIAFAISGLLSQQLNIDPRAISIGTLILMVPGLAMTNAISELAQQNFVSGTAKMMRAILTLIAMGTSYLLIKDVSQIMGMDGLKFLGYSNDFQASFWLKMTGSLGVLVSASIVYNVPTKLIPFTALTGLAAVYAFHTNFSNSSFHVLASFVPALIVGLLSLGFSRLLKVPSQTFSVPSILSIVPGMLALSSFALITNDVTNQGGIGIKVLSISSSIVFGLFTARIPFILVRRGKEVYSE
ncbi:MAG: threonine/serine exporter ThrE family protein [Bdellovibrionales bacterium]